MTLSLERAASAGNLIDPAILVQADQVHRDLYLDARLFRLEMQRLWRRAWIYVGHVSERALRGSAAPRRIADQDVRLCVDDNDIASVVHAASGAPLRHVAQRNGFVFARVADAGQDFETFLGPMCEVLDTILCRSPAKRFSVACPPLRTLVRANWKIYLENINDAVHPVSTHQSASDAAVSVAAGLPTGHAAPMTLQQLLPFAGGYAFFDALGGRLLPNGHTLLGTRDSIHTGYSDVPGYADALLSAHGEARARRVLAFAPQNAVIYPSVALKASPQTLRVLRPLAVDRTVIEAWTFQPEGAPPALGQRGALYNRLAFSPMSVVGHDDLHLFEGIHEGLRARANPWISLHRGKQGPDLNDVSGTDEALLRHQYRAWCSAMQTA